MFAADELKENVPIPGDLHDRWVRLNESSEKAFKAVESYNSFLEKQDEFYFKAFENENASNLSYVGFQLQERLNKMNKEAEVWTPDQLSALKPIIDQVKQAVIQLFPLWLKNQTILKPQQIGEFRFKMIDQCGKNLKTLGLKELYNQLNEHVNNIISKIEEFERISFIVDETNAFLGTHRVDKTAKISVLKDWKRNCKELTEGLTKAKRIKNIPEISSLLKIVDEFKKNCQKQIEKHANELGKLEGIEFLSIQDVQVAKVDVLNLREIFVGEEMDMEYLAEMDSQLKMFERDMRVWNDFSRTNEHLKEAVKIRIAECLEMQSEEDSPPWDTETAYNNFLEIILNERHTAAKKWYDEVYVAQDMIKQMSAEKCHELHNRIEAKPAYLDSTQINSLNKLQQAIDKRLDGLQIEGLLVRFKKLSKNQKTEFLSLAKAALEQ
ncbi:hypothetical protein D1AOALGA4SA_3581 [Olavius algarvensis Delta 1 endosymbiont]|nr:hypothetical protein D1AOALGA4SA_3581 [Olavius algarvensis Delta 1 endosymbiont]